MKSKRTVLAMLLLAGSVLPASAQEDPAAQALQAPQAPQLPTIDELTAVAFTPRHLNGTQIYNAAIGMYGRNILVRVARGTEDFSRFILVGHSLIVRDTSDRALEIVNELRALEDEIATAEGVGQRQNGELLVSREYAPRYVDAEALFDALGPLRRALSTKDGVVVTENVSVFAGQALHVHDTRERVAEIMAFLERLDKPAAQASIAVLVIAGNNSGSSSAELPAELVENLAKLVPMSGFELLSTGLLRGSVRKPMELATEFGDSQTYRVGLLPEAFDAAQGEIALREFTFGYESPRTEATETPDGAVVEQRRRGTRRQSFSTSATLRDGEYTVLGAVGSDPIFVVLRMHVMR